MNHNYTFLREKDRNLAFILEYAEQFHEYMKRTGRKWPGCPLKTLDPLLPESFAYWKECDGMRKVCDATDTDYGDFWRSAFDIVFGWDHPHPLPPLFFSKKGEDAPNVEFLTSIINGIEKPAVKVSTSPHYLVEFYVGSAQQNSYFQDLKSKLSELGRDDAWEKLVKMGKIPEFLPC